ncbi:MAG: InlB B-repeat-containing protein [Anaerococcus vaginalis]|nr:InlB B-repeat-containing protein [Anaerococcus vaginalis]
MNNSEKMIEIIEKKKELSNEKKPKYGTRKLSIGLVSCMLGFTLMISPILSIASDNANEEKISEIVNQEQSQSNSANQVEENIKATENKEELKFTDEQVKELKDAGYNENEINEILEEAKSKKAKDQNFDFIEYLKEKIKEKSNENSDKNSELELGKENVSKEVKSSNQDREATPNPEKPKNVDAVSSATYYTKANWENKIKDKSRWKVEDNQNLVRVGGGDPVQMNDIDYDGMFIDGNGRYVIRLVYKEKTQALSGVWYRALINFGDLDKYIDYDLSYVLGKDGKTQYKFDPVKGIVGRGFDLGKAAGDRTNNRANLPINLVLKEGINLKTLGSENYIVQMRVANGDYTRIYAYAPKGTSMDYSTYTKTTAVDFGDKLGTLFIKGGKQSDLNNATNQEFFMSEFISNPAQYNDKSNLGIIRTQYTGQGTTIVRDTVGGQPIAFTQVFDANLLNYMKADDKGNIGYVNVMTNDRKISQYSKNIGITREMINVDKEKGLAYLVIGTKDFKKDGVKVVEIPQHDQYTKLSGFYITAIDYVVDKGKFENTFSDDKVRKLNYTTMSGWTNPNKDGWTIYEKEYENDYVVPEGDSYLIDTGDDPTGGQIMLQIGGEQAILRKPQGYYNGYVSGDGANDAIEKYANGVYKINLREGATILNGKKLKLYMPYTSSHDKPVNFLEIHNGTKLNEGAATLTLQTNRNINMHLYKKNAGSYKLKYTLKNGTESSLEFKKGLIWQFKDKDGVMTGVSNAGILSTGGNFYIDTTKLKPGADIFVESYDGSGNKIDSETSWFKYRPLDKSDENVKNLTWTDHSDKKSVLSINKSLYTPYQKIFTNDYEEGNVYNDPRKLPKDDANFNKDTTEIVGYTKYDGGKIRTLYENRMGSLIGKIEADSNDYDDKGNLKGPDVRKDITINKDNIFDPQFDGVSKVYKAYEYRVNLAKMLAYKSDDKTEKKLELLKDMKFVSNASDGSSLPSDLFESRVRARILFDTTEGAWEDNSKKSVRIVPDNVRFYGDEGYVANGFEGENVEIGTGDKFPDAPKADGNKTFLGWVTAEGKKTLKNKTTVSAEDFNKLSKDQIFKADTPVSKHLVVYAIYSEDTTVTFDANGGKFADEKEQTTVKVDGGNVTKPGEPTKEGYIFKGWAATKDAKEADANILNSVNSPKTVYAVWEKKAEEPLKLNNPQEKVEVKDINDVSTDERDKIKDAVIKANPDLNLAKDDITVSGDGTVTVNKDGKTGTIEKDNTVTQKLVENNFNPPKEPVKVDKIGELKPDEIEAIKKAVKDANPERNFKDEDIKVEADGTVKINQGGKVGTIAADKTVVQKDTILDLNKPAEKVEVKNPANLSQEEKDEVAKKVKEANDTLAKDAKVDVDSKGNVTVTVKEGEKTKTGKLEAEDTVKPFTRDGKTLNPPAQKVKVGDINNLNENEKQAVKDAVKAANPELGFTDDEIQVDANGTVTVPMGEGKIGTFQPEQTIEEAKDTDNIIKLVAPAKTEVVNASKLTKDEKDKVIKAIKDANKNLPEGVKIEVADDGSVRVTQGTEPNQKVGQLSQKDTVEEKLKAPTASAKKDGSVIVKPKDDNAKEIEVSYTPNGSDTPTTLKAEKDQDGKWKLPKGTDASITIDENTGEITIPANKIKNDTDVKAIAKSGEKTSDEVTEKAKDEQAPEAPKVTVKDDGNVEITPPADADTKEVSVTYTPEGSKDPVTVTATKGDDGNWTLPKDAPEGVKVDPKTGKESGSSQYKGDEELDTVAKNSEETDRSNDPDVKYNTDTEYRNTDVDEAGYVSGPTAEGRRTRVDELSENPSDEDK